MASIDLFEADATGGRRPVILAGLRRLWATHKRRREERRVILVLSQLDEHLLRDIGLEPLDIQDAITGRRSASMLFNPMRNKHNAD